MVRYKACKKCKKKIIGDDWYDMNPFGRAYYVHKSCCSFKGVPLK